MKTIAKRFAGILTAEVAGGGNATARKWRLVSLLAIAAPILVTALLLSTAGVIAADTAKTYYLRNSGPAAFSLTLAETAGTLTTEVNTTANKTYIDTTINSTSGFVPVGSWNLTGPLPNQSITDLGSASVWVGLATTDDNNLKAIVRAEVLKGATVISTVDSACLTLVRTPASAASINLPAPVSPVPFAAGDVLSLRLSASRCNPAAPAAGRLRVHYNRTVRISNFGATFTNNADLTITKTDSPDAVTAGTDVTYTVTVSNAGPNNAELASVSDTLPAGVTFVSSTPSQGTCSGTSTVGCNLGTINAGNNATVTIVAKVNAATRGSLSNTATATATQPDPTTPNSATAETTVQASADLSITKSDSPDPVLPGGALTYSIQVTNSGPSTATAVTVTDLLPAGVTLVSATSAQGTCSGTTTVSCNLGTLLVGGGATVTIVTTVSASATGEISNTASVAATELDPTTPNTSTATTTVEAPAGADLSVSKTDSPDPVVQGQELTYTITVTNDGPAQATGVTLTDTLPAGVTFVSVFPGSPVCTASGGTVSCSLGSVDNGSNTVVTIKVKPGAAAAEAGTITNSATAGSTSTDPNPDNNTATADTAVLEDNDGDGISNAFDCTPTEKDNVVVDPSGTVPATFTGISVLTLQAAVIAASDNDVISMYADTTENVVVGNSTGSGGKDLLIIGCSHRVTAASGALPVIRVEGSAGAHDGDSGQGDSDIEIVDVDVRNGSGGYVIETSRTGGVGTATVLKAIRAESSTGIGVKVTGNGNEVRGANGVSLNASGIQVAGNNNSLTDNRIDRNTGIGLDVAGNDNLIEKNKVGEKDLRNGAGIRVVGNSNDLLENDVFGNSGDGVNVSGAGNLIQKNDVGNSSKGNTGDGIRVSGAGNTLDENKVFANTGDGIEVSGGTAVSPNVVKDNEVGDGGKGNGGNGILVGGLGNGTPNPVEIDTNTVKGNTLAGIKVTGSGHELEDNQSGGSGSDDNGDWEYDLVAGNIDSGDNDTNGDDIPLLIPGHTGTP